MRKISLILIITCLFHFIAIPVFSREIKIESNVVSINPELEFFVINSGKDKGIEMGDALIVHRDRKKIAEAYIIEVRRNVSAAEILQIEKGEHIQEGDSILIVKRIEEPPKKSPDVAKKTKSKGASFLSIFGIGRKRQPCVVEEGDRISLDINREPKIVFSYTGLILRENGYSITFSNRATGTLLATKSMDMSLIKELWADAIAAVDHRFVVSFEISGNMSSSTVTVASFREHSQKDAVIKYPVSRNSRFYNELVDLVTEIKERSEY